MTKHDLKPMLATLVDTPFDDPEWIFETKWDGFRIVADIDRKNVTLYSRNGNNVTARYPVIAHALANINVRAVIDGELTALDSRGRSRFQLLQNALRKKTNLRYYVFDLLFLNRKDLRERPLIERKKMLKKILRPSRIVQFSAHVAKRGIAAFSQARKCGEEGIIAKRAQGHYYSGKRTREWQKIKTGYEQEAVIVGFTKPQRSRKYFGSLILAVRERGTWRYVGRAGTGFNAMSLKTIHEKLKRLIRGKKPIAENVPDEANTTWVRPKLVGEIQFTEWTKDGEMRHPAFKSLREDKSAMKVVRERPKRV